MIASAIGLSLAIGGCSAQKPVREIDSREPPAASSVSDEPNVQLGRYIMEHEDEWELFVPVISFYENHEFSFGWSVRSSYYAFGTYEIQDQDVILNTDDGMYQYTFRAEGDSLIFDRERSSEIKTYEGELEVADRAVFLPEGDLIAKSIKYINKEQQ